MDGDISQGRKEAFRRIYQDRASLHEVEDFVEFSIGTGKFGGYDVPHILFLGSTYPMSDTCIHKPFVSCFQGRQQTMSLS
jgi:hypothetical protein